MSINEEKKDFEAPMENSHHTVNGNGGTTKGHSVARHSPYQPCSLHWLDLRVFYVRISKCVIDDSTPEYLTLNHIPLNRDTLLEVNGARTGIYSDGVSSLLRRDRVDKKSEEATFVSTDSIRMTGSVKYEVFDKDLLVLSGVLELCNSNGFSGESKTNNGERWSMNCESDIVTGTGFLNGKQHTSLDSASPIIEVYVTGCFSGNPIILTKTLQLYGSRKKQLMKGMLDAIPEYETTECQKDDVPSILSLQYGAASSHWRMFSTHVCSAAFDMHASMRAYSTILQQQRILHWPSLYKSIPDYPNQKPENEDYNYNQLYSGIDYFEGEDRELSWFNDGVRVGVGIGLSICLGIGMGVGLLVRTYQGTTSTFRRRLP